MICLRKPFITWMTRSDIHTLLERGLFPERCHKPELVETHISWVILCDAHVFKIKKDIHYSFLDFATLDKRRFFCEREVELNRRLAPEMYIGVVPVRKINASIVIGGEDGDIIDYAVHMRRLPREKQMDVLLGTDSVSPSDIHALAEHIAAFHRRINIIYEKDVSDVSEKFNDLGDEREYLQQQLGNNSRNRITEVMKVSDMFIDRNRNMLNERLVAGYFRDCHGDLHSRNIFLLLEPVIFDCIEFNNDFRRIDVLNEVAFLCMDLDAFGREDLSALFIQTYNRLFPVMRNAEEELLFIYYKCYRANVRAKVNTLRSKSASDTDQRKKSLSEAAKYLQLMYDYCESLI